MDFGKLLDKAIRYVTGDATPEQAEAGQRTLREQMRHQKAKEADLQEERDRLERREEALRREAEKVNYRDIAKTDTKDLVAMDMERFNSPESNLIYGKTPLNRAWAMYTSYTNADAPEPQKTSWKIHVSATTPEAQAELIKLAARHGVVQFKTLEDIARHVDKPASISDIGQAGKTVVFYHSETDGKGDKIDWKALIAEADQIIQKHGGPGPMVQGDARIDGTKGVYYRNDFDPTGKAKDKYASRDDILRYASENGISEDQLHNVLGQEDPFARIVVENGKGVEVPKGKEPVRRTIHPSEYADHVARVTPGAIERAAEAARKEQREWDLRMQLPEAHDNPLKLLGDLSRNGEFVSQRVEGQQQQVIKGNPQALKIAITALGIPESYITQAKDGEGIVLSKDASKLLDTAMRSFDAQPDGSIVRPGYVVNGKAYDDSPASMDDVKKLVNSELRKQGVADLAEVRSNMKEQTVKLNNGSTSRVASFSGPDAIQAKNALEKLGFKQDTDFVVERGRDGGDVLRVRTNAMQKFTRVVDAVDAKIAKDAEAKREFDERKARTTPKAPMVDADAPAPEAKPAATEQPNAPKPEMKAADLEASFRKALEMLTPEARKQFNADFTAVVDTSKIAARMGDKANAYLDQERMATTKRSIKLVTALEKASAVTPDQVRAVLESKLPEKALLPKPEPVKTPGQPKLEPDNALLKLKQAELDGKFKISLADGPDKPKQIIMGDPQVLAEAAKKLGVPERYISPTEKGDGIVLSKDGAKLVQMAVRRFDAQPDGSIVKPGKNNVDDVPVSLKFVQNSVAAALQNSGVDDLATLRTGMTDLAVQLQDGSKVRVMGFSGDDIPAGREALEKLGFVAGKDFMMDRLPDGQEILRVRTAAITPFAEFVAQAEQKIADAEEADKKFKARKEKSTRAMEEAKAREVVMAMPDEATARAVGLELFGAEMDGVRFEQRDGTWVVVVADPAEMTPERVAQALAELEAKGISDVKLVADDGRSMMPDELAAKGIPDPLGDATMKPAPIAPDEPTPIRDSENARIYTAEELERMRLEVEAAKARKAAEQAQAEAEAKAKTGTPTPETDGKPAGTPDADDKAKGRAGRAFAIAGLGTRAEDIRKNGYISTDGAAMALDVTGLMNNNVGNSAGLAGNLLGGFSGGYKAYEQAKQQGKSTEEALQAGAIQTGKGLVGSVVMAEVLAPGATVQSVKSTVEVTKQIPGAVKALKSAQTYKDAAVAVKDTVVAAKNTVVAAATVKNVKDAASVATVVQAGKAGLDLAKSAGKMGGSMGLANSAITGGSELIDYWTGAKEDNYDNRTASATKTVLALDPLKALTGLANVTKIVGVDTGIQDISMSSLADRVIGSGKGEDLGKQIDEINKIYDEESKRFKAGEIGKEFRRVDEAGKLTLKDGSVMERPLMTDYKHLAAIRHRMVKTYEEKTGKPFEIDGKNVSLEFDKIDMSKPENYMAYRRAMNIYMNEQMKVMEENSSYVPRWLRSGDSANKYNEAESEVNILRAAEDEFRQFETRSLQYTRTKTELDETAKLEAQRAQQEAQAKLAEIEQKRADALAKARAEEEARQRAEQEARAREEKTKKAAPTKTDKDKDKDKGQPEKSEMMDKNKRIAGVEESLKRLKTTESKLSYIAPNSKRYSVTKEMIENAKEKFRNSVLDVNGDGKFDAKDAAIIDKNGDGKINPNERMELLQGLSDDAKQRFNQMGSSGNIPELKGNGLRLSAVTTNDRASSELDEKMTASLVAYSSAKGTDSVGGSVMPGKMRDNEKTVG